MRLLILVLGTAFTLCSPTDASTSHVLPIQQQETSVEIQQEPLPFTVPSTLSAEELTDSYQGAFIRMLLSLAGLLALLFGTFWFLKRMGRGRVRFGSHQSIQILEKRALSPKTVLYVVAIEGKKILLSESQLEVCSLSLLEPETHQS